MANGLPVVCIFGALNINLESRKPVPQFENCDMDCHCFLTDDNLYEILAEHRPVVIVSFGRQEDFPNLMKASWDIARRWLNFEDTSNIDEIGATVFDCYIYNATTVRNDTPLVSVFTPAYKTGAKIKRPFNSLLAQTYKNWEWVIIDDSDDDGETFEMLSEMASKDYRIRLYRGHRHSGRIGELKKNTCLLARGEYLVELDHDDELTPDALSRVSDAFLRHPECGFVYTDFAECFEDCRPVAYGQDLTKKPPYSDWGHGYGSYREEYHHGQKYMVANSPNINAKTIRHIVAAPNHIRAWRKSTYMEIGGHGDLVNVADDYELMVRTFLHTRMCRVPHMCYVQYRNFDVGNTHQARGRDIQRLVRYFSHRYDKEIHERLLELGVDDFVWAEGEMSFFRMGIVENPPVESHCTVIA